MKKFKNNFSLQCSTFFFKKFIFVAIVFLIVTNYSMLRSQCLLGQFTKAPCLKPNCSLGDKKCIKLKIHYINNSGGQSNAPSDEFFRNFLNQINAFYSGGNIEFTYETECIHRVDMPGKNKSSLNSDLVKDANGKIIEGTAFDYKANYFNAYIYQVNGGGGYSYGADDPKNEFFQAELDALTFAHELGHTLSLSHTTSGQDFMDPSTWECIGGSLTKADMIPDTDADPFGMDIDHDHLKDRFKWVNKNNCTNNSSIFLYPDACGNYNWNPPIDNIMQADDSMDNNKGCWKRFTPCQYSAMHCEIENYLLAYLGDCSSTNPTSSCADITISIPTTWTNQIVEMCPKQRIIITATGSLTLVNTKITKKVANPNCPGLSGNWDGIHILGSGPQISYPGGPSIPSGGFIKVTSNSIIEFSDNGIQAPNSHLGITVENSIMRENGMAIYAKGPGGAVLATGVSIVNSQISNSGIDAKPIMVYMNGSNITINSSSLKNNGGLSITGLKSYNAHVNVNNNTTIDGFGLGIDKELNGGLGIGLKIQNSKIINGTNSIRNTSSGVSATKNFFGGYVNSFGKAYGKWHANNFRKQVIIEDPSLSHSFTENNFKEELQLNKNQGLTDARCNTWDNSGQAVFGQASVVKSEWGTNTTPSGNIWKSQKPYMEIYQCNNITNWEKTFDEKTYFEYAGQFVKDKRINDPYTCSHNLFPTSFGGGGGTDGIPYDDQTNRNLWTMYNNQYNEAITAIASATPTQISGLISQRENAAVGMGQCVLEAWEQQMNSTNGLEGFTYWQSKTDDMVDQMGVMIPLLDAKDFSTLNAYLSTLSLQGDESIDRNIMMSAVQWLANKMNENIDVLNLNSSDLNYLISLASSSFGNYTSLVRAFLNVHYNIHIDPPQYSSPRARVTGKYSNASSDMYQVHPNPAENWISISSTDNKIGTIAVEIFSLDGKKWMDVKTNTSIRIDLKEKLELGMYLIKISDQEGKQSQIEKLIIK